MDWSRCIMGFTRMHTMLADAKNSNVVSEEYLCVFLVLVIVDLGSTMKKA